MQGQTISIKSQSLWRGFGNLPAFLGHKPRISYGLAGQFRSLHMQHTCGADGNLVRRFDGCVLRCLCKQRGFGRGLWRTRWQGQGKIPFFGNAGLFANKPVGLRVHADLSLRVRGAGCVQLECYGQHNIARIGVRHKGGIPYALGGWPCYGLGLPGERARCLHSQGYGVSRIAGVQPVGVPAGFELQAQGHM